MIPNVYQKLLYWGVIFFILPGCAYHLELKEDYVHRPSFVSLSASGLIIRALDDSFSLTSQKAIPTPFLSQCWGKENKGIPTREIPQEAFFVGGVGSEELPSLGNKLATQVQQALQAGACPVQILVHSSPQPIYGLLLLCPRHREAFPGPNYYQISISEDQLRQAFSGKTTVSFSLIMGTRDSNKFYYDWILWLMPFPVEKK